MDIYTDNTLKPIYDNQWYVHPETGTQYPPSYPRDKIPGLHQVAEVDQPSGDIVITGFVINENYEQVWNYREKTTEEIAAPLIAQAKASLTVSDMTALRCFKAGVPFPQDWQNYVEALRLIMKDGIGDIPDQPDYPEGT